MSHLLLVIQQFLDFAGYSWAATRVIRIAKGKAEKAEATAACSIGLMPMTWRVSHAHALKGGSCSYSGGWLMPTPCRMAHAPTLEDGSCLHPGGWFMSIPGG